MATNPFSDPEFGADAAKGAEQTSKKNPFADPDFGKEPKRTWGDAAKDTGAAVMGGLAGLVKTGGDLYGLASGNMDNAASELGRNAQEYWSDAKSQALQTKIAQRKANIDAQESTLGKAWTAVKDTLTDPALAADTVAENVATMLPGAGVGRAVGAAKYARGFQAASEFGPASLAARAAIAKQAGRYATGAAIGTGAVQQGADVSGDIYSDLMKKADAEWDASPDFQAALQRNGGDRQAAKSELANATARAAFLPAAGISVAANAIPGATYLERALVGAPLRTGAKEVGRFGAARGFARGVLGEGGQEFVEEGGGRLGANLAAQQLAMPGHDTWDGVGENAGMGFAGGALLGMGGGVHGAREAMAQKRAQDAPKAAEGGTPPATPPADAPSTDVPAGGGPAGGLGPPAGTTMDMAGLLAPANPLLEAMNQRAADPEVITPPINEGEIFDKSAHTPVAGELYQPGDTTNPLTGERITAKPSEAMGINPADGPLSTGAAIAVDTGVSGQMQQAAALAEAVKAAPKTPAGEAKTAAPDLSGWSDQQLSDTFRAAQAPDVRRQLAVELSRRRDVREQQALRQEMDAEQAAMDMQDAPDDAFANVREDAGAPNLQDGPSHSVADGVADKGRQPTVSQQPKEASSGTQAQETQQAGAGQQEARAGQAGARDESHLNALELRLSHERGRLRAAKTDAERATRQVTVDGIEREIAGERKFLGLAPQAASAMSDDALMQALKPDGAEKTSTAQPPLSGTISPQPQAAGPALAAPEFTTIKTVHGDSVTVRTSDLQGDAPRLRQYTKAGKAKAVPAIHRDNLDLTGEKSAERAKENAKNPLFHTVTTKDGGAFASQAAAQREVNRLGLQDSHEVVEAGGGFVGRIKKTGEQHGATARNLRLADERTPGAGAAAPHGPGESVAGEAPVVGAGQRQTGDAEQPGAAVRAAVLDAGGASEPAGGVGSAAQQESAAKKTVAQRDEETWTHMGKDAADEKPILVSPSIIALKSTPGMYRTQPSFGVEAVVDGQPRWFYFKTVKDAKAWQEKNRAVVEPDIEVAKKKAADLLRAHRDSQAPWPGDSPTGQAPAAAPAPAGAPVAQGLPEAALQTQVQGQAPDNTIDALRQQLRAVEAKIIEAAPAAMGQGGGDIDAAMKSRAVPVTLKAQRKKLKEQIQQAQSASESQSNQPQAQTQQAQAAIDNVAPDAEQSPAQETTYNGTRIYPTKIKVGDEVKSMWAVESPDNRRRRAAGERTIGGDSLHDTIEQAKAAAEREAKRDAEQRAAKAEQDAADKARLDAEEARKAANRPKTVVERRKDAILDGPSKIGQGTKRAVITTAVDNGYAIEAKMVYDHAAKKRDQEAVDRASRAGYILGVSNENLPLVKAGNEAKARLKEGKYEKPEYRVYQGSDTKAPFREITKTEYDYAQELKAQRAAAPQAEAAQPATPQQDGNDFLPEGWTKSVNGFTKRPVYRMEQGVGQPFAVVTQTEGMTYEVQIRHGDKQLTTGAQRGALSEVLAAAEAELGRMTQADSVTHADPGEKAEAATPAVVTDSLKKAASNEDTKPSEMRKWLVAEIDKELLQAPDRADYDEAVKRLGEKDAISMFTGNGPLGKNSETGFITFDVPGDGKYKVRNSVRGLLEFRKNVMASQGFKDSGQKRVKPEQNRGVQGGSGGSMAAITNMIEEGDFEAARDYAEAVGIKLEDVKVPRGENASAWKVFLSTGKVPEQKPVIREWTVTNEQNPNGTWSRVAKLKRTADGAEYEATVTGTLDNTRATYVLTKDGKEYSRMTSGQPFSAALELAENAMPKANDKPAPSKASDTGWNMAGTGFGGKRYIGRNITLDDGREVVARVYENAGNYDEVEVKVDGVRKFTVTDRDNAQGKADAFIRTLQDGDQAAGSAKSPTRVTPQISGNPEKFIKVAADSVRELRSVDVDRVLTETPVQFRAEVASYIRDQRKDLADEVDDVMADIQPMAAAPAPAPATTGARRDPAKVSMFNPYEDGDIVTINGQDWTVKQDTPGWYLTNTGNWRGTHPTIRNIKAMADLIREVEQAATASPAAQPEAPKLTPAEAKSLMEWQDLGQKDGVKTHALTFYESQADKDAKRGRMIVAKVTKGDRSASNWMVDGDDKPLAVLGMAKKRAEDAGMARLVADGYVGEAPTTGPKPARITPDIAANMKAGDVVVDEDGKEYRANAARHGWLEAHPIVDGKAQVNADSRVMFHLDPQTASAYPERSHKAVFLKEEAAEANPLADYNALAQEYGFEVRPDGAIGSDGKFPGPKMKVKGGRLRIESGSGDLLASYAGTSPDGLGKFLESFWYAEKKAGGATDAQGPRPMFSRAPATEVRNLVTLHNLTDENLRFADSMGGIPVPSIGITKVDSPFSGFGGITLIAPKGMVDPESGVPVFDRDAWTARFPEMNFKKPKRAKADAFYERMKAMTNGLGVDEGNFLSNLWESMVNASVTNPDKVADHLRRYDAARLAYARDVLERPIKVPMRAASRNFDFSADAKLLAYWKKNGDALNRMYREMSGPGFYALPQFHEFSDEVKAAINRAWSDSERNEKSLANLRGMYLESMFDKDGVLYPADFRKMGADFEKIGVKEVDRMKLRDALDKVVKSNDPAYLRWVQEQVKPLFDAPTITLRGKEVEPTLDNIVDAMTVGATAGVEKSMTFGPGKLAAHLGKRFKSMAEIKAARDQVVSESAETEAKKATDAILDEYRTHLAQFFTFKDWRGNIDTWAANDSSMEALARAGKQALTDANIRAALSRKDFKGVDQRGIDLARQAIEALRSTATNYFEAKPQRAVRLNEFKGAVVPKGIPPESVAILEKNGITVEFYGKAEGAREKAIEKLAKRLDRQSGDVLFARSETPPADSNARNAATQLLIDGLKAKWTRAPEIIVARNMQDAQIPQEVRDYDETLKSQGATGEARGFIYKGKVYLLSDQLKGPQQIAEVLFHEVLGHYGLRGVFGKGLDSILQQMGTMRRKEVVAKAREYGLFDSDALGGLDKDAASDAQIWAAMSAKERLSAAEEVLAEMAQTQPNIGFVQRAIAAIRNWLRAHVPGFERMRLTDADIVQAYILPARGYVTRSNETVQQAIDRAMLAFSRAYHGTPHRGIEKFSTDKIGTGEGAQAYGWGLYFASKREIAEHYRKALQTVTRGGLFYKDKPLTRRAMNDLARSGSAAEQAVFGAKWPSKDIEKEMVKRAAEYEADAATKLAQGTTISNQWAAEYSRRAYAIREVLAGIERRKDRENGQLYEVEIPEDSEMLLWDRPLSEQPKNVKQRLKSALSNLQPYILANKARDVVDLNQSLADMDGLSGEIVYRRMSSLVGSDMIASRILNKSGIKGIKYLDGGSRSDGDGSYNYVIFNGDDVQIERAHFSRTSGDQTQTENFRRWFAGSKVVDAEGKPLRVYHGTAKDFSEFDVSRAGQSTGNTGFYGAGAYFTQNTGDAAGYAGWAQRTEEDAPNLIPAYLSIQRPVYVHLNPKTEAHRARSRDTISALVDTLESEGFFGQAASANEAGSELARLRSFIEKADYERAMGTLHRLLNGGQGVSDLAQRAGFDGVLVYATKDGRESLEEAVAFRPEQVKSAIGNNGNFDPNDPDIRFSRTTEAAKAAGVWVKPNESTAPDGGGAMFSRSPGADQTQTEAFKRWFAGSKVVDGDGKPLVVYHGSDKVFNKFDADKTMDSAFWFTSDLDALESGEVGAAANGAIMPVYLSAKKLAGWDEYDSLNFDQLIAKGYDGIQLDDDFIIFSPNQIKSAIGNNGDFDPSNPDIRFSRTTEAAKAAGDAIKSVTVTNIKQKAGFKLTDYLGIGLQALGRRQIVDIYGDMLPLGEYNRLVQQMEADKNEGSAEADQLVNRWAKLEDEGKLADLMHDTTLAQIDPAKPYVDGDDKARYMMLQGRFNALTDAAKQVYTDTRDSYQAHHAKVRSAIKERIERSEIKGERKAALLKQMDDEFFKAIKGVYFPLARFGQYAVTVNGPDGKVESVSRAETKAEAEALRNNLLSAFPRDKGFTVGRVMLSKDFIADRDAVGRGFMTELYQVLDKQDMDAAQRAELEDTLGQLYLSSLPDLSWAKHGIHRKGTPGFSQDARRAFAQNMFHGARYLAKLRYSDLMQDELAAMQKHVDDWREVEDFDQNSAQRVVDEMNKRHESLMNPKSNPLSTALTSLGFVFHLGLSPASAMVNLSQTALVAYPIMGAKWGFGKASAALLKASQQAAKGKNDITGALNAEERAAYDEAVRAGTIDVTMAHDLAGIAQGEDAGVMWKIRPVMRWASFLFHHAERFNRQVTFVAAYRLAREAGADNKAAFEQATKATYDGHFDYSASNRARIMQGNVAKVLLLFKQYGQNMVYTLSRNAYQSINGTDAEKAEARKVLAGLLTSHAMAAGVLGLPMVTTLLAAASMIGGDDDEPWDAKVALQNLLADTFGQKPAEVLAHGLSRLTPWDISGRVGLDRLIFPDVQEGLEGQRLAESAMAAALGPVAGIGVNMLKGAQHMSEGRYALGLEAMLPSALRGPVKAIRYANEGVQDKSGISILDEVSPAAVAGQALGFSPSQARNAQEGKSAVMAHDRALGERRQELLTKAARATMAKDAEARAEAMKEIERFNQKNPTRRITPLNVLQSVRNRNKRIDQAQDGVYLPRNRRDAMDAGRFAFAGTD